MVQLVSTITNIGQFDNYILEIRFDELENDITDTIDRNREDIGSRIGEENVYVKPLDEELATDILDRLDKDRDMYSMPWLILLDEHPNEVDPGDRCMVFELGEVEEPQAVTRILREIQKAVQDEGFARRLSYKKKLAYMKENLSTAIDTAGLVVTVATFV